MRLPHKTSTLFSQPGRMPGFAVALIAHIVFIALMLGKLILFHHDLHLLYIPMDTTDKRIAAGCLLAFTFWIFWLPVRGRIPALALLDMLLSALIFADLVYFRYFGDFITVPVLLQAGQVESLGGSIAELLRWSDLWLFADWPLLLALGIWSLSRIRHKRRARAAVIGGGAQLGGYNGLERGSRTVRLLRRFAAGLLALAIGFSAAFFPIREASQTWAKNLLENNWWNVSVYNVTGLLGFHALDVYQFARTQLTKGEPLPADRMSEIENWFADTRAGRSTSGELFGKYKGSNVIVVQGEAFMNFFVGKEIEGTSITPNLDKLMEESLYFSNFYHQTGQGRTSDADLGTNISLHPLPSGSVFIRYADNTFDSMPSVLKEHGYSPNVYHAYDGSFWNRTRMYKNMGYDRFYTEKDYEIDEPLGWSVGDRSFLKQSVGFMEETKNPFYSFLITLSSHHPYNLSLAEEDKLDVGEFEGTTFGDYLQAVHYVDSALGEMTDRLKADGLWDDTIFVFYGDHDYSLDEPEAAGKLLGRTLSEFDYEQIMAQVPLLIHLPDGAQAGVYDQPGGQLDIEPTLLPLLGIPAGDYMLMGNDLLDRSQDEGRLVVLRSGAFTDGEIFYSPSEDGLFENGICYDLKTGQPVDVERARAGYEEASLRLSISDDVIERDLIPDLHEDASK
ncbi:LTA synthase family protein [Saccharibacillus sp. CPCC 101409]|uniref:LTA synthase family protein n=1 Tax=Saccharibacillus sp. CPCC 101409 TaxID=3058041 RepID=UPI0026716557|nr:LTA synthase family protein [Saccharibacillus sp. CPCC 101409]MDO3408966.1 LTA synthase family protein [Saccharibacillus sp. CPCC 101409]